MSTYKDENASLAYLEFGRSEDGKIQRELLLEAIKKQLNNTLGTILDAGCGDGWLVDALAKNGKEIVGCDLSPLLIDAAKKQYPNKEFEVGDIQTQVPFGDKKFDAVILNMVFHDLENQKNALKNISGNLN